MSSVIFINCFQVPAGRDVEFLGLWRAVNDHMQTQQGYVSHQLHRSLSSEARYRFVNVAQWDSADDFAGAHDAQFQELVGQAAWADFPSTPALCEVVHERRAAEL